MKTIVVVVLGMLALMALPVKSGAYVCNCRMTDPNTGQCIRWVCN